ncbi:unnamed protein product [Caenorhabditis angaria]|uniref:Uncharacterized protein n=1 Tax=Caenorhabditis angaria TaxID=860376 RepID=A0A9P1I4M8_9PELO|nr:unnamed protein product [Caenorhabditis angaria]
MDEILAVVEELITKTVEKEKRISYRAKTSGLGALLESLRNHETQNDEPSAKIAKIEDQKEKPLNRKERRALKQAEFQEKYEQSKKEEVIIVPKIYEKAVPPKFYLDKSDDCSYQDYKASFGYSATRSNNYLRYSKLNKSGNRAAVASQDRYIRIYNDLENDFKPSWKHSLGGLIYDIEWINDENIATTSKGHPIQLWNSENGERLCSYVGKDNADAVDSAFSIGVLGNKYILGGYKKDIKFWDIEIPGKPLYTLPYIDKFYKTGLTGRAMSFSSDPLNSSQFVAVGCSDRISVYADNCNYSVMTFSTNGRGYTYVKYSEDSTKIYASERKGDIHCYDLRMNMLVQVLKREMNENHRTIFDIDVSRHLLYSGTSSGEIQAFDLGDISEILEPISKIKISSKCVPCVSINSENQKVIACSGERIFPQIDLSDEDENEENISSVSLYSSNSLHLLNVFFEK